MALQFHLVPRKNLSKNVEAGKEKLYYAQTRATGTCSFDELCEIVAESSTASSGDVKVVIDRVIKFLLLFLARGEVVQCGELGTFQLLQTSSGSVTVEEFSSSMLYRARLIATVYKQAAAVSHYPRAYAREIAYSRYISEVNGDNRATYCKMLESIAQSLVPIVYNLNNENV